MSAGFFLSEEFRGRGYFAYKFYEVGFDRRPTYAEFVPDMAQVGGPQSPESEVISKAAYTDAFVQRQEFKNRYDALSNSAYVDALETNAEVTLANKAALIAALDGNQKTRAQVLREIVELQVGDGQVLHPRVRGDAVLRIPAARPGHDWLRQLGHHADGGPEQLPAHDLRIYLLRRIPPPLRTVAYSKLIILCARSQR